MAAYIAQIDQKRDTIIIDVFSNELVTNERQKMPSRNHLDKDIPCRHHYNRYIYSLMLIQHYV